jgi:hypothetical protein
MYAHPHPPFDRAFLAFYDDVNHFFLMAGSRVQTSVGKHYFSAPALMGQQNVETAFTSIRQALTGSQNLCYESVKLLLKVRPSTSIASPNCCANAV